MKAVSFSVGDYSSIHSLTLGASLAGFMEFDLKPFYSKCSEFAENSLRTREYDENDALLIKDLIRSCHPYVTACYNGSFKDVVLDCVIEVLCKTLKTTTEALWARNISANDALGKALFGRISEYKTGKAVNQWANLKRMQGYAVKKTGFIFGQEQTTQADCELRATYFDLAFSTAAKLGGCETAALPHLESRTPALLPGAAELLSPVTALLEPTIERLLTGGYKELPSSGSRCLMEQFSGVLCDDILELPIPQHLEMLNIGEKLRGLPRKVYIPTGFKAIIDLELEELLSSGTMLQISPETGRWYEKSIEPKAEEVPEAPAPQIAALEEVREELVETRREIVEEAPAAEKTIAAETSEPSPKKKKTKPELPSGEKQEKTEKKQPKEKAASKKKDDTAAAPKEKAASKKTDDTAAPKKKPASKKTDDTEAAPKAKASSAEKKKAEKPPADVPEPQKQKPKQTVPPEGAKESPAETPTEPKPAKKPVSKPKTKAEPEKETTPQISIWKPETIIETPPKEQEPALELEEPEKPDTIAGRMMLLQDLAADKQRALKRSYEGEDIDVLCQSVNTALQVALKDEWEEQETEIWAKHLIRIRGGMLSKRFSRQFLLRFLEATIQMYKLDI